MQSPWIIMQLLHLSGRWRDLHARCKILGSRLLHQSNLISKVGTSSQDWKAGGSIDSACTVQPVEKTRLKFCTVVPKSNYFMKFREIWANRKKKHNTHVGKIMRLGFKRLNWKTEAVGLSENWKSERPRNAKKQTKTPTEPLKIASKDKKKKRSVLAGWG